MRLNRAISKCAVRGALLATAAITLAPATSWGAGDAQAGIDVFAGQCAECHSMKEGKNKKGPSLFAVVGRKAAAVADFKYSDAMTSSGFTWTPEQIDAYVAAPKKAVPGGAMKYDGLPDAKARADLIAYLASVK